MTREINFRRVLFLIAPTGDYCREDRCQSFFERKLIPSIRQPLEECEAAGAVSELGGSALIVDAPALKIAGEEVHSRLRRFAPDLIVLTTTFSTLQEDLTWSREIKSRYPSCLIALRGAPCFVSAKEILEGNTSLSFCLHGDYEVVLQDLLLNSLDAVRGITYRDRDSNIRSSGVFLSEEIDQLPFPDRSSLDMSRYTVRWLGMKQATIRVQRGCPFTCSYCLVHTVSGAKARHRSPESIVQEMRQLRAQGFRFFYLRADTLTLNRRWVLALADRIRSECPDVNWVSTTRVECVDGEILESLKSSGCYGLSFGVDVLSEQIAQNVGKPLELARAKDAFALCRKYGIISLCYVMIGFAWETDRTLSDAETALKEIDPDLVTVHYAFPYPGTRYHSDLSAGTLSVISDKAQSEPAIELSTMRPEQLAAFGRGMLRAHYLRVGKIISLIRILSRLAFDQIRPSIKGILSRVVHG